MINNKPMTHIAFLGPQGSYSHIAAIQYAAYYYSNTQIIEYSCQKFSDILNSVKHCQAEYGILPIENSNSGCIDEVCDLLINTQLTLVGEITIPIKHCILVNHKTSLDKVRYIYSHPQPIQQCSKFLKIFSQWNFILCKSSAAAMKTVSKLNQSNIAALGSMQGGTFYGLRPLLSHNLSNHHKNTTRFIILKNNTINTTKLLNPSTKTMLIVSINQNPATLYTISKILKIHNINKTFLKSITLKYTQQKRTTILLELQTNLNNCNIQQALIDLQKISYSLKILGCYPSIPN